MTPQQETDYASRLHDLPKCDLIQEYETQVEDLVRHESAPFDYIERVRLARRELARRLPS